MASDELVGDAESAYAHQLGDKIAVQEDYLTTMTDILTARKPPD